MNAKRRKCAEFMAAATLLPALISAAAALPATAAEKYALVVGVDRYRETELSSLDFADDDAVRLGEALRGLGFDVVTMTSAAERVNLRPDSPPDILETLDRRLRFCDKEDLVVVSLSGHGVQLVGDALRPDGTRETWFCPAKAKLDDQSSLLAISQVVERMKACPAARKLLLVDACRNDMAPPGTGKARDAIARELDPAAPARRLIPDGMVALFSCSARERSFERKDLGHSLFSYHVIEYLSGHADDPGRFYDNGEATLTDLVAYTQKQTSRSAERLGADQTPELIGQMTNWSFGRITGNLASADHRPTMLQPDPKPAATLTPPSSPAPPTEGGTGENSIGIKLIRIEAGEFQMGSNFVRTGETKTFEKLHAVRITKPFLIGMTEVTQEQFEKVMQTTPWQKYAGKDKQGPNQAAFNLSWDDAVAFCRKLTETERRAGRLAANRSYRLPTEAEWEYACRAGTTTKWSFGDNPQQLKHYAVWYQYPYTIGDNRTFEKMKKGYEVGTRPPNKWQLHDMHGNVEEWCSDWYGVSYYDTFDTNSPAIDPQGASSSTLGRVLRGGSSLSTPLECRSADRHFGEPAEKKRYAGFRVVCELE